jgi:hypothetical protein
MLGHCPNKLLGRNAMKQLTKLFAIAAFGLMVLALPSAASAQWRDRGRNDDNYGNGRYNRNIGGTLQNLKNRAKNFEKATNRAEDRRDDRDDRWGNRGPWGNNRGNRNGGDFGRLEDLADSFKKATDRLEDAYGNGRNLNGSRDEARRVLEIGNQIENQLRGLRSDRNLEQQWRQIRNDLNTVSSVYGGYYGNGNNNRYPNGNGNGNGNGDWRNRLPFPF